MAEFRNALPQLEGELFLTDAGVETDLMFNHGIEIQDFAAHTLLADPAGRAALTSYFRGFLALARALDAGFILDSQTWKAHPHWASLLGTGEQELRKANRDSIEFISGLKEEFAGNRRPIVLNGIVGPCGDAYLRGRLIGVDEAEDYHATQLAWLAETDVDMVTAVTFNQAGEAAGLVRAARRAGLPVVVSFTVETDGRLPTGQSIREAIQMVDEATSSAAAYFMLNCAHPDHFSGVLENGPWARRIRGLRCNASRKSHRELDQSELLDAGDPAELAAQYGAILQRLPWLNVFGGCCGTDLRHVTRIARVVSGQLAARA